MPHAAPSQVRTITSQLHLVTSKLAIAQRETYNQHTKHAQPSIYTTLETYTRAADLAHVRSSPCFDHRSLAARLERAAQTLIMLPRYSSLIRNL
jgi:uncharacterized membrane protein